MHVLAAAAYASPQFDEEHTQELKNAGGLCPRVAAAARHKRPETTAGARDSLFSHRVLLRRVVGLNKGRKWRTGIASRPFR